MGLHGYFVRVAVFLTVLQHAGSVAGKFTAAPPTCPGSNLRFSCTVGGDRNGVTIWRVGSTSECTLPHSTAGASSTCGAGGVFMATSGSEFGTSATFYSSTLSGTATLELNGTLIECFGPNLNREPGNRVGDSTLQILGPPSVPTFSCVDLSEDVSGAVNVTVSWTLSGGDSADFYLINITTNAPQTPYGGLLNITIASVTQYELTGFMTGYEYNITVRGICGGQEGSKSDPLRISPQVPATPTFDVCAVYDSLNRALQFVESTWMEVDTVTLSEDCTNGQDVRASYELFYTTGCGTHITNCVVNGRDCSNGRCHHELHNNTADRRCQPPLSLFGGESVSVSLTARNIVGRSNSAVPRSISGTSVLGVYIDTTNPTTVFVECTFYQPGYTCTIDYGTDPSYTNLVYRDTTSTQGRLATITLSQRLRGDTTYYYIVSAVSGSQCVRVRGRFQTGCFVTDLTPTDAVRQCADRGLVNTLPIPSGVVCYNRTTAGSEAVYICDEGFHQDGAATRVCQSGGVWNGSIPQCLPDQGGHDSTPSVPVPDAVGSLSTGAVVGIIAMVTGIIALIVGFLAGVLVYHCIHNYRLKNSKPKSPSNQHQDAVSASNPLQQTGPEYEEVVELRRNKSYEFRPNIEMRANISKLTSQSSKPESSSQQQQQTSTEYEEVVELRRNKSYEFRPNIEMRANISKRQSQSSEPESSSQQQQQTSTEYEEPVPDPSNDGKIDLREDAAYGPSNVDFVL